MKYAVMIFARAAASMALLILCIAISGATIINVPEDYSQIQAAIDAAQDGDEVLVQSAEYNKTIIIDKTITVRGVRSASSQPVIIPEAGDNAIELLHDGITLSGFDIANRAEGVKTCIYVNSDGNFIHDINITGIYYNDIGISLNASKDNEIYNCTLSSIDRAAIHVQSSPQNRIYNNTIFNCQNGIYISESDGCTISKDNILNNVCGIVFGNTIDRIQTTLINCTFSGNAMNEATSSLIGQI